MLNIPPLSSVLHSWAFPSTPKYIAAEFYGLFLQFVKKKKRAVLKFHYKWAVIFDLSKAIVLFFNSEFRVAWDSFIGT